MFFVERIPVKLLWTGETAGGILIRMILLGETASLLEEQTKAWTDSGLGSYEIRFSPNLPERIPGDPRVLDAVLLTALGAWRREDTTTRLEAEIVPEDGVLTFRVENENVTSPGGSEGTTDLSPLGGRIRPLENGHGLEVFLPIRGHHDLPPVNLDAMAEETGLEPLEAGELAVNLVPEARARIQETREAAARGDFDTLRRTAHAMKGSARTLRAPVLALAAKIVEESAANGRVEPDEITKMAEAWREIERWLSADGSKR